MIKTQELSLSKALQKLWEPFSKDFGEYSPEFGLECRNIRQWYQEIRIKPLLPNKFYNMYQEGVTCPYGFLFFNTSITNIYENFGRDYNTPANGFWFISALRCEYDEGEMVEDTLHDVYEIHLAESFLYTKKVVQFLQKTPFSVIMLPEPLTDPKAFLFQLYLQVDSM